MQITVYLAGYSKEKEYRSYSIKTYGEKIFFFNPMNLTHLKVIKEIGRNEYDTYIVRRDKKMILSSDILVAYIGDHGCSWGTSMEIIFAYEHGIPVYVIDATKDMINVNDAWVKFHTKKSFPDIDSCFKYIISEK